MPVAFRFRIRNRHYYTIGLRYSIFIEPYLDFSTNRLWNSWLFEKVIPIRSVVVIPGM